MKSFAHYVLERAQVNLVRTGKRVRITIDASPCDRIVIDVTEVEITDSPARGSRGRPDEHGA